MTDVEDQIAGPTASPPNPLQDRVFVTTSITEDGARRPVVAGTEIRLQFGAGSLGANAGCNAMTFPVQVGPDRLVTGQAITTLMLCDDDRMAQEAWLTGILDADPGWSLTDRTLVLTTDSVRIELREEVDFPRPLGGRSFRSRSLTGAPRPLVPGTSVLLSFSDPDTLTVDAGCNTVTYWWQTGGGGGLHVGGPTASTDAACSPELTDQDEWLRTFLVDGSPVDIVIEGNVMTLSQFGAELVLTEEPDPNAFAGLPEPSRFAEGPLENRRFRSLTVLENGEPRPLVGDTVIDMILFADSLTATAGCNRLSTSLTVEPDRLVVGPVSSTEMFCGSELETQDEWLATFLRSGPAWAELGGGLLLTSGATTIEFTEVGLSFGIEPTELWGTTFESISVTEKGIVPAPVVDGTTITLAFTAPDVLTAEAGCNTLGFRVTVGPDRLTVDDEFSSTRIECKPELMAQDEWLAKLLTDDPEYGFTGGTLTLTRGGTSILLAARTDGDVG